MNRVNLIRNIFNNTTEVNLLSHGTLLIIIGRTQADISVMYSLREMQKIMRVGNHVCLSVHLFQLGSNRMNGDKILYEVYVIGGHPKLVLFNFLQLCINISGMGDIRITSKFSNHRNHKNYSNQSCTFNIWSRTARSVLEAKAQTMHVATLYILVCFNICLFNDMSILILYSTGW
jgi:hypothetical protein